MSKKYTVQIMKTQRATVVVKAHGLEELRASLSDGEVLDSLFRQLTQRTKHVQTTVLCGDVLCVLVPETEHHVYMDSHDTVHSLYLND